MISLKFSSSKTVDFSCESRKIVQNLAKQTPFAKYIFSGELKATQPEFFACLPTNTILIQFLPNSRGFVLKKIEDNKVVKAEAAESVVSVMFNHFYCAGIVKKFLSVKFELKFPLPAACDFRNLPDMAEDVDQKQALEYIVNECRNDLGELGYYTSQLRVLVDLLQKTPQKDLKNKALEVVAGSAFECRAAWFKDIIEAQKILMGTTEQELKTFIHTIKEQLADAVIAEIIMKDLCAHGAKVTSQTNHAGIHLQQLLYKQNIYVSHTDLLQFKDNPSYRRDFGIHGNVKTVTAQFLQEFSTQFILNLTEKLNCEIQENSNLMNQVKSTLQKTHTDREQERQALLSYNNDGVIKKISPDGVLQLLINLNQP